MDLARYDEAYRLVKAARESAIDLHVLEAALNRLTWDVHAEDDPNLYRIAGPMLLVLAEYDLGHASGSEVIFEADALLQNQTLSEPAGTPVRIDSVARNIWKGVRTKFESPVAFGQPLVVVSA